MSVQSIPSNQKGQLVPAPKNQGMNQQQNEKIQGFVNQKFEKSFLEGKSLEEKSLKVAVKVSSEKVLKTHSARDAVAAFVKKLFGSCPEIDLKGYAVDSCVKNQPYGRKNDQIGGRK